MATPAMADMSLALNSFVPNNRKIMLFSQILSGGLWKNGSPLKCKVSQSPLKLISLETCTKTASSKSLKLVRPRFQK
jgi:hypothetical protein